MVFLAQVNVNSEDYLITWGTLIRSLRVDRQPTIVYLYLLLHIVLEF